MNKKLILFDYDGTIADTNFLHEMAFREVLNFKELTFNYEQIAGIKTVEAINFLLQENKIYLTEDKINSLVIKKQKIFSKKKSKDYNHITYRET